MLNLNLWNLKHIGNKGQSIKTVVIFIGHWFLLVFFMYSFLMILSLMLPLVFEWLYTFSTQLFAVVVPVSILISSLLVILLPNPIYSLLALIFVFLNTAIFLLSLKVQFLALIYLIVYIGAIAILFLFVIMLFNLRSLQKSDLKIKDFSFLTMSFKVYFFFGVKFFWILALEIWTLVEYSTYFQKEAVYQHFDLQYFLTYVHWDILLFSHLFYTYYSYVFLLSGLVLLAAMIGSIVLALSTTENFSIQLPKTTHPRLKTFHAWLRRRRNAQSLDGLRKNAQSSSPTASPAERKQRINDWLNLNPLWLVYAQDINEFFIGLALLFVLALLLLLYLPLLLDVAIVLAKKLERRQLLVRLQILAYVIDVLAIFLVRRLAYEIVMLRWRFLVLRLRFFLFRHRVVALLRVRFALLRLRLIAHRLRLIRMLAERLEYEITMIRIIPRSIKDEIRLRINRIKFFLLKDHRDYSLFFPVTIKHLIMDFLNEGRQELPEVQDLLKQHPEWKLPSYGRFTPIPEWARNQSLLKALNLELEIILNVFDPVTKKFVNLWRLKRIDGDGGLYYILEESPYPSSVFYVYWELCPESRARIGLKRSLWIDERIREDVITDPELRERWK